MKAYMNIDVNDIAGCKQDGLMIDVDGNQVVCAQTNSGCETSHSLFSEGY